MSNRLKDKVALVTAAGQGIGKATAIAFHNEGAKVIATDINDKTLAELNKEYPKIEVKNLDSTNYDTIKKYVSEKSYNFLGLGVFCFSANKCFCWNK